MLPATLDKEATFSIRSDERRGFHLLLVRNDMLLLRQPLEPLWVFTCGDKRSLDAAAHWCEVRRACWQGWGRLAQALGPELFVQHMAGVIAKEPIGEVQASIVKADGDPAVLILAELLFTHQGVRDEVLYRHRFGSPELRDRFFAWFSRNSTNGSVEQLLEIGIRKGTSLLGEILNELASSPTGDGNARGEGRSRRLKRAA